MSSRLIHEGLIALKEMARGPIATPSTNRPEFPSIPGLDPVRRREKPRRSVSDTIGQDLGIARPDKLDNNGRLLRKGVPGTDLKQKYGPFAAPGTYIIPNYGRGPGVGKRALSEQDFIKNIFKKEPQSSGDFLAKYVTSGEAGKNAFVAKPSDDPSKMNPIELIKTMRKAQKFMNNPSLDKPVPGRRVPGSGGSPVDDPTGQFGRPGLPGGQTAQSVNDLTYRDFFMSDDLASLQRPTVGRENIERRKQNLVDLYGPDVDKGSRRASAEAERKYRESLDARRNSTLSQNNIYPQDTRNVWQKARGKFNRFLGRSGSSYDSPSQKDPTTIRYSEF